MGVTFSGLVWTGYVKPDLGGTFRFLVATTAPLAHYDPSIGFRYQPGQPRIAYYSDGKKVYDHVASINQQGWFSTVPYAYQKEDSTTKRLMVLGDSYSAGFITETTWVEKSWRLAKQLNGPQIDLYNFAQDGTGLRNWEQVFFNEIVPNYEFDGIIIAASAEPQSIPSIDRKLMLFDDLDNDMYLLATDTMPVNDQQFEEMALGTLPGGKAIKTYRILQEGKIENLIDDFTGETTKTNYSYSLYFTDFLLGVSNDAYHTYRYFKAHDEYYKKLIDKRKNSTDFNSRYQYANRLDAILEYCRRHNKQFFIVHIPDKYTLMQPGTQNPVAEDLKKYCKDNNVSYFDGFEAFSPIPAEELQGYYLPDEHWNDKATTYFSYGFVPWLLEATERP